MLSDLELFFKKHSSKMTSIVDINIETGVQSSVPVHYSCRYKTSRHGEEMDSTDDLKLEYYSIKCNGCSDRRSQNLSKNLNYRRIQSDDQLQIWSRVQYAQNKHKEFFENTPSIDDNKLDFSAFQKEHHRRENYLQHAHDRPDVNHKKAMLSISRRSLSAGSSKYRKSNYGCYQNFAFENDAMCGAVFSEPTVTKPTLYYPVNNDNFDISSNLFKGDESRKVICLIGH